jgi:TonB-linked SusC/RagA family outer membrane protein
MRYFASVGYQRDGDIYNIEKQPDFDPRYYYNRYNWRSNFDFDLTKTTQLSVNISGNMSYRNNSNNGQRNVIAYTVGAPTNAFPIRYSDGTWGDNNSEINNILAAYSSRGQRRFKTLRSWYDLKFKQQLDFLTKGLSFSAQYSYNTRSTTESLIMPYMIGDFNNTDIRDRTTVRYNRLYDYSKPTVAEDGSISYPYTVTRYFDSEAPEEMPSFASYDGLTGYERRQYYEFALNYARAFGDHNVTALALVNRQIASEKDGNAMMMTFPSYREDWVGRVTYNFKERYLMEVNMSYTGSDRFSPENRFGFFPSFSVGYRLTEEPFMKKAKEWLTNFKVRYSWGQVGQDTNNVNAKPLFRSDYTQSEDKIQLGYTGHIAAPKIYREGPWPNLYASWEVGTKQNLGLEMQLFNKLGVTLDLYDEKRDGILTPARSWAFWLGTGYPTLNMGETKNHGIELELSWDDKIGKDFRYFATFALAASENRIIFKDDPNDPNAFPPHLQDRGKPIDWQSRYIAVGNYGSIDDVFNHARPAIGAAAPEKTIPGDYVLMDFNGDGQLNDDDRVVTDQLNYPQTTYSLNFGFEWKGLGFSALIYSPQGIYRNTFDYFYMDFPMGQVKAQPHALDRWTYATANTEGVRRPSVHLNGNNDLNTAENTFRFTNYSYIRLKNVELSYKLPKKLLNKLNMDNVRVYVSGNNLFTISDVDKRVDPETDTQGAYPIVKSYTLGLNFSF